MLAALPSELRAQPGPPIGTFFTVNSDSGSHDNPGDQSVVVFTGTVQVPGTAFIRIFFSEATLPPGSSLRLTSVLDGAEQDLDAASVAEWEFSSAFFNGPAVQIELIAGPHTTGNRYVVNQAFASQPFIETLTICGPTDDRVPLNHPAVARMMPGGCTASIYAPGGCMLSAGHCDAPNNMVEFNVPPSLPSGTIQHPPPSDQYMIDPASRVSEQVPPPCSSLGDDWFHFRCLPNTQTGLLPIQAQHAYIPLATSIPMPFPQPLTIYGYGVDDGVNNQVEQRGDGPLVNFIMVPGSCYPSLRHQVDTTGGNSGSPIIESRAGRTIGIHTHSGCGGPNDSNGGTPITFPTLQAALTCKLLVFSYPYGAVTQINPAGGATLHVAIEQVVGTLQTGSPQLHVSVGGEAFSTSALVPSGSEYLGFLPAGTCSGSLTYYISAATTDGTLFTDPYPAPASLYTAVCTSGDVNLDGHVSLIDYAALAGCLSGPGVDQPQIECMAFRFDTDEDVDLRDVRAFLNAFTGP
ncbi:MAG TPA: hypothetical protein VGM03_19935 [Phycisphaerae bacterium]